MNKNYPINARLNARSFLTLLAITTSAPVLSEAISPEVAYEEPKEISQYLSTIIDPEPIKRVAPKYPIYAAKQGREGSTVLSFVIDKQGSVSDVLVKESSGSKDFDNASVRAASKWKYKPALENGKPIQQCVNTVRMDFRMGNKSGEKGVSRRFKSQYKKALQGLKEKNYQEVEKQLNAMRNIKYMHLSESNYMHYLAANYAKETGDKVEQLNHLKQITMYFDDTKEPLAFPVLYEKFYLEVMLNKFRDAYRTYNRLSKLEEAKPYMAQFDEVIAKLDVAIGGNQDIVINAVLDKEQWSADLVRHEFSLTNIEGSLHTLDVRCANKRHVYTVEENSTWQLPVSWENCSIYVYGEKDTRFNLIEHPLKS